MARAGRRSGPTTTPEQILDAARELFAERGYQSATVRAIAERADVNSALIHHYFASKEKLYVAALRMPLNPADAIVALLDGGPREEFAERLVRFFVRSWRDPQTGPRLQAFARSAIGSAQGATSARQLIEDVVLTRAAQAIGVPPLRVATALTHLIGLMIGATIIGVEPLASASEDELVALVTPAIAYYLLSSGHVDH